MNRNISFWFFQSTLILLGSCQKKEIVLTPLSSLNLVNAVINQGAIKANFTGQPKGATGNYEYYSQISTSVSYGSNFVYPVLANGNVPITVVATSDTTTPIYSSSLNLVKSGIYSLFLTGQSGAVDAFLINDTLSTYLDSSYGVRFINLSLNSNPFIVTMASTPTSVEFGSLGYKQVSSFKQYPATSLNNSYAFQVRDAVTNVLLWSYSLTNTTIPYFHNITLAWIGQPGGTGSVAQKVVRVNNY